MKREIDSQAEMAQKELEKLQRIQETRLRRIRGNSAPQDKQLRKEQSATTWSDAQVTTNWLPGPIPVQAVSSKVQTELQRMDFVINLCGETGDWSGEALCSEHWRHYSKAARSYDDLAMRRLENASWRLWVSGGNGFSGCIIHAQELLKWMDSDGSSSLPLVPHKPTLTRSKASAVSDLLSDPKDVLHKWHTAMSLVEKKAGSCDGQLRSRLENQVWRAWAMALRFERVMRFCQKAVSDSPSFLKTDSFGGNFDHSSFSTLASQPMSQVLLLDDRVTQSVCQPAAQPLTQSVGSPATQPVWPPSFVQADPCNHMAQPVWSGSGYAQAELCNPTAWTAFVTDPSVIPVSSGMAPEGCFCIAVNAMSYMQGPPSVPSKELFRI